MVWLAGLTILGIAIFQTVSNGSPDPLTWGAVVALAGGGSLGKIADGVIKGYVAGQVESGRKALEGTPVEPHGNGSSPAPRNATVPLPGDRDEA